MKNVGTEFTKGFTIGILIFIIISLIEFANGYNVLTSGDFLVKFGFNQLYSVVLYLGNAAFFRYLIKRFDKQLFKTKHLPIGILGGILVTLVCLIGLRFFSEVIYGGAPADTFLQNEKWSYYYVSFIISAVVTSVFYGIYYYKYKQESKFKEQKIIAGTASAKFDALKNQLDPHFLFNSLNVLTSLIEENPEAATNFTTSLSKVYRYVLEQKNKDLVTVAEELKFAALYMSLLKMRFEDSIIYTAPETLSNPEAKVVPLALQLLLENAVKHNQVTPSKKLHINIIEKDGNLLITNNLQPKQVLKDSTGVGLFNIKQRYKLLTDRPVSFSKTSSQFSVTIPLLTQNIIKMNTQENHISKKKYELAKEQVKKLKGFYVHFTIYLIFIPVFLWLWYQSNTSFPWFVFPIGGWGIGVLSHASEVYDWNPIFSKDWERRQIRRFMEQDDEY